VVHIIIREDYGLEGRVHVQNTQVEPQDYAWMIIHRDPSNDPASLFLASSTSGRPGPYGTDALKPILSLV
jgi:hypothetical protein